MISIQFLIYLIIIPVAYIIILLIDNKLYIDRIIRRERLESLKKKKSKRETLYHDNYPFSKGSPIDYIGKIENNKK